MGLSSGGGVKNNIRHFGQLQPSVVIYGHSPNISCSGPDRAMKAVVTSVAQAALATHRQREAFLGAIT